MGQKLLGLVVGVSVIAGASFGDGVTAAVVKDKPPVATGEFQLLLVGKRIGEERFRVFKGKKDYRVESTTTLYWPGPSQQQYEWKLDRSFQPDELTHNLMEGGRFVTVELRKKGKSWRSEVKGKGIKKVKQDMGQRQHTEIDFGSPIFQWITFRHLTLAAGERVGVDVILLEKSNPTVKRIKRTYTRLPDEDVESAAQGQVVASVYEITQSESSYRLWLDPSGFPIRSERETPEGPLEFRLVRFKKDPRAW